MFVSPKIVLRCIAVQLWYLNKFFLNWIVLWKPILCSSCSKFRRFWESQFPVQLFQSSLFCENLFHVQLFYQSTYVLWKLDPYSVVPRSVCFVKSCSLISCAELHEEHAGWRWWTGSALTAVHQGTENVCYNTPSLQQLLLLLTVQTMFNFISNISYLLQRLHFLGGYPCSCTVYSLFWLKIKVKL